MKPLPSQWRWLAAGVAAGMLALGGILAIVLVTLWPKSATMEVQVNGWTLPVRGVFNFSSEEVPRGLRLFLPWEEGTEVAVTAGTVREASDGRLVVTPYDGSDDRKFDLPDGVRIFWGIIPQTPASLTKDTPVLVFVVDKKVDLILAGPRVRPGGETSVLQRPGANAIGAPGHG